MGNFDFVRDRWPKVWEAASRAESYLRSDPRAAAYYTRLAGEMFTDWIYQAGSLPRPRPSRIPTKPPSGSMP